MGIARVLLALAALAAQSQDTRVVTSPDGKLQFRLLVTEGSGGLPRIAYDVSHQGKPVILTSYLGFDIEFQEPILGEKAGLMSSSMKGPSHLIAHYMQDGSIGRLLDIEVNAWNDRVAFRYSIPPTTALEDSRILTELTEFHLPINVPPEAPIPFVAQIPGQIRISIGEEGRAGDYPPMTLIRSEDDPRTLITHFAKPWNTVLPLKTPWRVITVSGAR